MVISLAELVSLRLTTLARSLRQTYAIGIHFLPSPVGPSDSSPPAAIPAAVQYRRGGVFYTVTGGNRAAVISRNWV